MKIEKKKNVNSNKFQTIYLFILKLNLKIILNK